MRFSPANREIHEGNLETRLSQELQQRVGEFWILSVGFWVHSEFKIVHSKFAGCGAADGGDLETEDQNVEGAGDGHAEGHAGFFKEPAGDGIRLAVLADEPPGAEDIERFCPQKRDDRESEKGGFKRGHGLGKW